MQYGRDHDEREQKILLSRANITLPQAPDLSETEPQSDRRGSEPAPTQRAQRREAERHRRERELGHVAAGTEGHDRAENLRDVTREDLEEAARRADEDTASATD